MKLISVIVPIYKVEKYLDKCVESIVGQTYRDIEIILVDDGSPDKCPEMCDEWAKKDGRIKVIHKENGGLSDARNAGLSIVKGEYISFVDSDDWISPCFLETMYQTMQNEDADIVECGVTYVDEQGNIIRIRKNSALQVSFDKIEALRQLVLEEGVYQTVWNKLYKRDVIGDIKFEVGKYNEDDFWTYQVFDRVKKVTLIEESLYYYLQRGTSIMGAEYSLKRMDGLEARFRRMEFLQKYDELAMFVKARIMYDCLYHFQAAVRYLRQTEQKVVTDYIIGNIKELPSVLKIGSNVSLKYKIWFIVFRKFPFALAKLRNKLGIGL